jgi:Ca2+-binding EF-hand superfamily protein
VIKLFQSEFVEVESNVKTIFSHFDADGKGKIDCDKLRVGAEELGIHITDKQANSMIQPFDSNMDGAVDLKDLEGVLAA